MKRTRGSIPLFFALFLSGCDGIHMEIQDIPTKFQSNGERIYYTGTSVSRDPLTYSGGNMHMQMMGGGCTTCHGSNRGGGRMMPRFWLSAPPLTREALFENHAAEDGHGAHGSYDSETFRRAIFEGIDPSGEALDSLMPRWSMSERDLRDLLNYLKQ